MGIPSKGQPSPVLEPEDIVMEVTDKATVLMEFKGRAENKERDSSEGWEE